MHNLPAEQNLIQRKQFDGRSAYIFPSYPIKRLPSDLVTIGIVALERIFI